MGGECQEGGPRVASRRRPIEDYAINLILKYYPAGAAKRSSLMRQISDELKQMILLSRYHDAQPASQHPTYRSSKSIADVIG